MNSKEKVLSTIICFTKNRNKELKYCLQSIKNDLSYAKSNRARHIYILDDSTDKIVREKNRKLAHSISIPNASIYYHGQLEYKQLVKMLYKQDIVQRKQLSKFFRSLGHCKWDLGGVRNYALLLLLIHERSAQTTIFVDDDIQIQPLRYHNIKLISSIELMENEINTSPTKIVSGAIEIVPDSSILWRIADYQLNLSYAISLDNRNILLRWIPKTGNFTRSNRKSQSSRKSIISGRFKESAINYKVQLHNPFDCVKNFPIAGGFMGFAPERLIKLPFPRTYNEDFIWAVIAETEYGVEYVKTESIGYHLPPHVFNLNKSFIAIEEYGELFFYGIYLATQICTKKKELRELLNSKWYWEKIIVERKLEVSDLPNQNRLLKSMIQNSLRNRKEKHIVEKLSQAHEQLKCFDEILLWIDHELNNFESTTFINGVHNYWRIRKSWENLCNNIIMTHCSSMITKDACIGD